MIKPYQNPNSECSIDEACKYLNCDAECVKGACLCKNEQASQEIIELCKMENKVTCDSGCVDGFGEDCYFDSSKYNPDDLKTDFTLPEETKKACFAIKSYSECGNCYKKFELKINDKFEEVSCEEFFSKIEAENKSCNGCINIKYAGCC